MMFRLALAILICGLFISTAFGQAAPLASPPPADAAKKLEEEQKRLQRQMEIRNLVISAENQISEVSADLLFAILDAKLIEDPQKRIEILDNINRRSQSATERYKLRFYEGILDSRSGFRGHAYRLGLDSLSIQVEIAKRTLSANKIKGRQTFAEIPELKLPPLTCEDDLGYDFSEYYSLLRAIVETTFDREAVLQRKDVYFASEYLGSLSSSAQVGPAIDFLVATRISGNDLAQLVDAFTVGLRRIAIDPRSFGSAVKHDRATQKLRQNLLPRLEKNGISTVTLVKAYRAFFLRQISTVQCSDFQFASTEKQIHPEIENLEALTKTKIDPEDTKPEQIKTASKPFLYWKTVKAKKLLEGIKSLRFGTSNTALTTTERSSVEWQDGLLQYLNEMEAWKAEDEATASDYLNQKSVLYDSLFELVPQGVLGTQILQSYAMFLRDSSVRREAPAHWLFFVKRLFRTAKNLSSQDFLGFLDEVSRAGNEELSVYAEFEKLRLKYPARLGDASKIGEK